MIRIIETFRSKNEHAVVNGMLAEILSQIFKEEIVKLYAQSEHFEILAKYIFSKNLKFQEIKVIGNENRIIILFHYIFSVFQDIKLYLISNKNDKLFYFSVNPLSLLTIKLMNKIFKKKLYLVCHGELEYLLTENHKYLPKHYRIIAKIYKFSFFRIKKDYIKYIVLGESILKNIEKLFSEKIEMGKFISIDHPYNYEEIEENIIKKDIIRFSTVGVASTSKGTEKLFAIAKDVNEKSKNDKFEFSIIGKMTNSMNEFKNEYVKYKDGNEMRSREEFENEVINTDYVLYLYPKDSYRLIASGAFFDAIAFEKPIIAIENDFFKYYFEKYGEIGYLCQNENEVSSLILDLIKDNGNYEKLKCNIKKAKKELQKDKILKQLKVEVLNETTVS